VIMWVQLLEVLLSTNFCEGKNVQNAARFLTTFYRAMHFSAKRGIAIACRLSVRLSVCDVGEL